MLVRAAMLVMAPCLMACGGEGECGPGDAPPSVSASVAGESIAFGGFTSSPNNDCTPPGRSPTSITLDGRQTAPATQNPLHITFCLPRPDLLGQDPIALDNTELIEVVDVFAELSNGCLAVLDRAMPASGTIQFQGYCGGGVDPVGYSIVFDARVPATAMCPDSSMNGPVTIELGGPAEVQALSF